MYKRHKVSIAVCMALTIARTFFLGIDYASIAEIAITVVAITLAVYTSVASVLIGNPYAHKMKKVRDSEVKTKTSLGVIASYLRGAGLCSTATIVISTIYLFEVDGIRNPTIYQVCSSLACGLFAVNILFMWLVFKFLVNTLTKAAE